MDLKPFARKVLASCTVPIFSTDEVAEMARAKPVTIRSWITRGYLTLQFATRPGKGRSMEFAPLDAIEVMTFSQMSMLGFAPNKFAGEVARWIVGNVLTQMHLTAETENFEEESKNDYLNYQKKTHGSAPLEWLGFHRYLALMTPLPYTENLIGPQIFGFNDLSELTHPDGSIYVVTDCRDFAEKSLQWFSNHESRF